MLFILFKVLVWGWVWHSYGGGLLVKLLFVICLYVKIINSVIKIIWLLSRLCVWVGVVIYRAKRVIFMDWVLFAFSYIMFHLFILIISITLCKFIIFDSFKSFL